MEWNEIRTLHVEITTMCNAVCPGCARYPTAGYFTHPYLNKQQAWTLDDVKERLPIEDLTTITTFYVNGTVGDFIANKDALDIVRYIKSAGVKNIFINTNGGARDFSFWTALGELGVTVNFALDGLADTHSLYRREINFNTVIENAKAFIQAGGNAVWIMTVFEHNKHQVDLCKEMSITLGFIEFTSRQNNRGVIHVFNRSKELDYTLTPPLNSATSHRNRNLPRYNQRVETQLLNDQFSNEIQSDQMISTKLHCHPLTDKSVYITGEWSVVPCCFIGNSFIMYNSFEYKDIQEKVSGIDNARLSKSGLTVKQSWEAMNHWKYVFDNKENSSGCTICKLRCGVSDDWIISKETTQKTKF